MLYLGKCEKVQNVFNVGILIFIHYTSLLYNHLNIIGHDYILCV